MDIPFELYPYQRKALDAGREAYRSGKRAGLFVGPTGMGKTVLFTEAAVGHVKRGGDRRVVVIVHRRELERQTAQTFERAGLEVGWQGRRQNSCVQVTSIQSILADRVMPKATLAIIDEAHHYAADEWSLAPIEYLKSGALLFGVTATPERDDGRGMGGLFDFLVVVAQVRELVALNAIDDSKGITPIDILDPQGYVRKLAKSPAWAYSNWTPGRHAVVFAPNVLNAYAFAKGFADIGIEAPVIHGNLDSEIRDQLVARFASGEVKVIVNVNVLTEGWDAPICDTCILARKIGSLSLYYQTIGRARRALRGKRMSYLLDLSGNYELHGHPDDDLVYELDGAGISRGNGATCGPRKCRRCGYVLDDAIREAHLAGGTLENCPDCKRPISQIVELTPEEVELKRVKNDEARRAVKVDTRVKALATLYEKGILAKRDKDQAHQAYRGIFKAGFPPSDVRARAWRLAVGRIAETKGDAWDADQGPPGAVDDADPEIDRIAADGI